MNTSGYKPFSQGTEGKGNMRYIEDGKGHRLPYTCQLAEDPASAPILLSFHGWLIRHPQYHDAAFTRGFPRQDWNYIAPQDRYGLARGGCWYLGENADFFFIDLIDHLIAELRKEGLNGPLYVHGTSMGGFGALLHGMRLKAKAICVSVPQVRLLGTELHREWKRAMDAVFGKTLSDKALGMRDDLAASDREIAEALRYADATNFIHSDTPASNPLIFITQSAMDVQRNYVREQALYLADKLAAAGIAFYMNILPEQAHIEYVTPAAAVTLFEQYQETIDNPVAFSSEKYDKDMAEIHGLL